MRRRLMTDPLAPAGLGGQTWPLWQAVLIYVAGFTVMTWPWLSGRAAIPWDAKATFLPQVQFLAQSVWRGEAPWWNPYVFAGLPQVADPQSMIFSPPFLLLALVNPEPGPWAGDLTVLAAMWLGGLGLILWFRDQGWHWAGALIGALAFVFGAAMAWRIQHWGQVLSLCYLPWVLLFLDRALKWGSWSAGIGAGVVAAFLVLGRDQIALMAVYLLAARVIVHWLGAEDVRSSVGRSVGPLIAGGVVGGALVAFPVLMTVVLAAESNRPDIDYLGAGAGSLHPALLTTFVIPQVFAAASGVMGEFWGPPSFTWVGTGLYTAQNVGQSYIGAIPLLAIVAGAASGRLWEREIRFFAIGFVVCVIYGLGWYTPMFRMAHSFLPGVSLYRRPADAVFMVGGLGAILAGYVVHTWFSEPWRRPRTGAWLAVAGVFLAAVAAAVIFGWQLSRLQHLPWPLVLAAVWFASGIAALAWALPRAALMPWAGALVITLVTALDLAYNNGPNSSSALPPRTFEVLEASGAGHPLNRLKSVVVRDERRRDRVELVGLGFHWPNASMTHRLENTLGYNPVRLDLYSRATGAEDHVGLPDQRKFLPLFPSYRSLLADMLGLRWIASPIPLEDIDKTLAGLPEAERPRRLEGSGLPLLFENPNTLPRVLFANSAKSADFEQIIRSGEWPHFDPRTGVLLTSPVEPYINRLPGSARLIRYGQNHIEIEAVSPTGGWVVLNDVWHPWWHAEVDGVPAPLLQANVLFRAVKVDGGRRRIVMTFRPFRGVLDSLTRRQRPAP